MGNVVKKFCKIFKMEDTSTNNITHWCFENKTGVDVTLEQRFSEESKEPISDDSKTCAMRCEQTVVSNDIVFDMEICCGDIAILCDRDISVVFMPRISWDSRFNVRLAPASYSPYKAEMNFLGGHIVNKTNHVVQIRTDGVDDAKTATSSAERASGLDAAPPKTGCTVTHDLLPGKKLKNLGKRGGTVLGNPYEIGLILKQEFPRRIVIVPAKRRKTRCRDPIQGWAIYNNSVSDMRAATYKPDSSDCYDDHKIKEGTTVCVARDDRETAILCRRSQPVILTPEVQNLCRVIRVDSMVRPPGMLVPSSPRFAPNICRRSEAEIIFIK